MTTVPASFVVYYVGETCKAYYVKMKIDHVTKVMYSTQNTMKMRRVCEVRTLTTNGHEPQIRCGISFVNLLFYYILF